MTTHESISSGQVNRQLQQTPVAIVGMASIFPQASNLQTYWENILHEVDCIAEVPPSRWKVEDYYDPDPNTADKTYSKRGGFIPDIDFNPMEFGLPPNLLEVTDISQLLSLVVAKQALEDSGYGETSPFNREQAGIILGVTAGRQLATPLSTRLQYPIWERVLKHSGLSESETQAIIEKIKLAYVEWNENAFPGLLGNVVAGRIANRLDLGGMNCTVDAACASSLAAFKIAISELTEYRSNLMLTGGVDTDNTILTYLCFSKTPALSRTQQSRPFDVDSDGILLGEGIGMAVLKRLEDAERDGDRIYATINGIGTSSDGRFKSIYAPRAEGQVKALQRAYQNAGFNPASVGLIEAHGTGTVAGDTTEFEALKQFFGDHRADSQSIALGTIKSQIGHTKAAAGAASVIKVALALHHKILPPTINVETPNPKLDLDNSPFYLNTKARPWMRSPEQGPRRAGISSFGFGGTNFHLLMEEYVGDRKENHPACSIQPYSRLHRTPASIVLFATTPARLLTECQATLARLQSETGPTFYPAFVDACQSAEIPEVDARLGFMADSLEETCRKLEIAIAWLEKQPQLSVWEHPKGIYYRETGINLKGKVVALFSGQGSQYLEMGRELAMNFPELQRAYSAADGLCVRQDEPPISAVVFPAPTFAEDTRAAQVARLRRTEFAQPAIGAFSVGLFKILEQAGFKPDFAAGHSFGELTALWAAKVLSDEDYFALVNARGQAMATPSATDADADAGAMLAVKMALSQVEEAIRDASQVAIANVNSPQQVVLAGARSELETLQQQLQSQDALATLLPVAAAFHTPLVAYAQKPFAKAIESVTFHPPQLPVYTNLTGQRYPADPATMQKILKEHLLNRVQFKQEIETIYAQGGYCFVEFGPKATLTHLVKEILGESPHIAVALNASAQHDSDRQFREAVLQLRIAGLALNPIDADSSPPAITADKPNPALNVRLCANNYVSEKAKLAFEKALQNGHGAKVLTLERNVQPLATEASLPTPVSVPEPEPEPDLMPLPSEVPTADLPPPVPIPDSDLSNLAVLDSNQSTPETESQIMTQSSSLNYSHLFQSLDDSLTQLNRHQCETLQVHAQYLSHQMEYAKIFSHLVQQQGTLYTDLIKAGAKESVNNGADNAPSVVLQSLERNLSLLHEHQTQTLDLHGRSLEHQTEHSRNLFHLAEQQYRVLLGGNAFREVDWGDRTLPVDHGQAVLPTFPIVEQRESQPHRPIDPVLELPTDPVSATQSTELAAPPIALVRNGSKPPAITQQHGTDSQNGAGILRNGSTVPATTNLEPPAIGPTPSPSRVASSPDPTAVTADLAELEQVLLAIVSEKTGYPGEMLELDMDMEADLGIDSIKRVEILGALQERFPSPVQPNLEDLAELRTLAQIAAYMQQIATALPHIDSSPMQAEIRNASEFQEAVNKPNVSDVASHYGASNGNGNGVSNGNGTNNGNSVSNGNGNGSGPGHSATGLMESRNGHPGASVAIAADRGAVIAANLEEPLSTAATLPELDLAHPLGHPRAPDLDPPQIPAKAAEIGVAAIDAETLSRSLLEIVSEKTGYPVEMLELDMDMEADLGIDSIKRVEILGTVQERFPGLPQPNLEDLAELRTLGQIVSFLGDQTAEKKTTISELIASPPR